FPAHATSMGRMILAGMTPDELDTHLDDVDCRRLTPNSVTSHGQLKKVVRTARDQGWCVVDQELEPGLRSVAAPVRDATGRTVAAINVSTQTAIHPLDSVHRTFLPAVIETAQNISADYAAAYRSIA
ncbi:MAG TPA: IclR family transcriptional regulator, partial [Corynebacterium nuruki]|nr:IclR family transcriptional regulator [Corynebacterium nuruki]